MIIKKRILLALVLLNLASSTLRASGADSSLLLAATNAPPIRLAITGFAAGKDKGEIYQRSAILTDLLMARLSQVERFQLVERKEIDALTREMSLSLAQTSNPEEAIRAGKMLRADWLLLGSLFNNEGTNTLIAKIVEAQTGIIRDLAAISIRDTNLEAAAEMVAEFIQTSADRVSRKEQRIFLGIGGFEDLGVNSSHPEFRASLRAFLEQTYRGTRYSVVERSMVNPLLKELHLSLGGLTEPPLPETAAQPAFLLVDGTYQSFHEERAKVNLILRVQEVGGHERLYSLKEPPGKGLNEKVSAILSAALGDLKQNKSRQVRTEEAAIQLTRGIERARIQTAGDNYYFLGGYEPTPALIEREKRLNNINEAIEAFEAALLLDPYNAEAKIYLAICLLDPQIGKKEAGRDYLTEVIATSTNVAFAFLARRQLACSYRGDDDRHALDLLLALDRDVSHSTERMRVQEDILQSAWRLRELGRLTNEEGIRLVEQNFLVYGQFLRCPDGYRQWILPPYEIGRKFGNLEWICQFNRESAEEHWEKFLPKVVDQNPDLAPHIWASYVLWRSFRIDGKTTPVPTNILAHLKESLEYFWNHPAKIAIADRFAMGFATPFLEWSLRNAQYGLGENMAELFQRSIAKQPAELSWLQKTAESAKPFYYAGYCKRALGKWQQALDAFEIARGQSDSVIMAKEGPWGKIGTRVNAADLLGECRQHLGLPGLAGSGKPTESGSFKAPAKFDLGEPILTLGRSTVFACDGDQIWLTDGFAPFVYDKRGQTLTDLDWPTNIEHEVTCIRVGQNTVWWGTRGSGLVEMDKRTKRCRVYKEAEGLLLPSITALALSQDRLWIGFGTKHVGGIGYLDLRNNQFTGMTPELGLETVTNRFIPALSSLEESPRSKIWALYPTKAGDVWLLADDIGLRRFSKASSQWNNFRDHILSGFTCMAVSSNFVAVGGSSDGSGVVIHSISNRLMLEVQLRDLLKPGNNCAPRPCPFYVFSLAMDGEKVWVGGEGFLALVDLESGRVEKLCDFDPRRVLSAQALEIEGDFLWIAIKNKLYRLPKGGPVE